MKRHTLPALAIALLVVSACRNLPPRSEGPVVGSNGLSAEARQAFYHTPEGSELVPASWVFALQQPGTGKPFLENIERFGLLRDEDPLNRSGLPIGLTTGERRGIGVQMLGINCAACHVNEIEYKGTRIRIDGAPNMFDIAGFYAELRAAIEEIAKPVQGLKFIARLKLHPEGLRIDGIQESSVDAVENRSPIPAGRPSALSEVEYLAKHPALVKSYLTMLVRLSSARINPSLGDTPPGFGRADAFGTARVLLFGLDQRIALDAPASFPHLWGLDQSRWIHWIANSNSVMQRNIGEALGLGASADPKTGESTIRLDNLHQLETLVYSLKSPTWPEAVMGAIQQDRAARGKTLYDAHCWECHDNSGDPDAAGRFAYRLFRPGTADGSSRTTPSVVATDPGEAQNFSRRIGELSFARAQTGILSAIEKWYYEKNNVPLSTQREWNRGREPAVWRDINDMDGNAYTAKPLAGIWATAPYLHNGSVPTVDDLLSPADKRPVTFSVGQREYDPEKLGYLQTAKGPFTFDTRQKGNRNFGHEIPGTLNWTGAEKRDLLEFLKTVTARVEKGPYATPR